MPTRPPHPNIEVRAEAINLFLAAFDVFPSLAQKYLTTRGFAQVNHDGKLFPARAFIPLDAWLNTLGSASSATRTFLSRYPISRERCGRWTSRTT
jgi:hypothetical protein